MKHTRFHSVLMMLIGTGVTCHYSLETPAASVTCKEPGLEVNDKKNVCCYFITWVALQLHDQLFIMNLLLTCTFKV